MIIDNYIICPCCGKKIGMIKDEAVVNSLIFFNHKSSKDEIIKALNEAQIELAAARWEGNDEKRENCFVE